MTPIRLAAAAGLLGLAAAGPSAAQDMGRDMGHGMGPDMGRGHHHELDFVVIDADGDGTLTRTELQARAVERLARADANGDGALDRAELVAVMPASPWAFFATFGPDPAEAMADRTLALMGGTETGRVEIVALADRRVNTLLAAVDTDRDAAVSQAEAEALRDRHRDRGRDRDRDRGDDDRGSDRGPDQD
jgi:Ca2+-binding EF-hand superfamily protein